LAKENDAHWLLQTDSGEPLYYCVEIRSLVPISQSKKKRLL